MTPEEVPYASLDDYHLIGFGSGVYYGSFRVVMPLEALAWSVHKSTDPKGL